MTEITARGLADMAQVFYKRRRPPSRPFLMTKRRAATTMTRLIVSIGDLTQTYDWPATIELDQVLALAEQFRAKGYRAEVVPTPSDRRRERRA